MKIAIEAQRIFRPNKHGMDFVVLEMVRQLQQIDHVNEYHILVAPGSDRCLQETPNFHIHEVKVPSYPLWEQVGLPRAIRQIKPDLLHCTSNTAPICGSVPLVLTLHDIIFLEKRDGANRSLYQNLGWYYRRLVVPRILPKCQKVITVSDFERDNICRTTGLSGDTVMTVHNGFSQHFHPIADYKTVVKKYIDSEKYFFFLGNTDPKKNTKRVLKAYAEYLQKSEEKTPLLIADLNQTIIGSYLKELGIESIAQNIVAPGYIANTDLPAIYSGAQAFLYTSLRESFGIPLLEAMACGTPVISSNISAIPEIAGDGAILIDPYQESQIAAAMLRLETDTDYYQQSVNYGLEHVKLYSWRFTAEKVLKLYSAVIQK